MWVYRTRASLELVLETDSGDSVTSASEPDLPTAEDENSISNAAAKQALDNVNPKSMSAPALRTTLWMRRKRGFKLKLEGISTRGKRRRIDLDHEAQSAPGVQILERFEKMIKDRMESCERVSKMVKGANLLADNS
jgi:hypothetical protein